VIGIDEHVAVPCDALPPLGPGCDRQAAHYYRSQHARAVQREPQWTARALAAAKSLGQLLVWVGWCGQQIEALKGQLAWLKQQPLGRKSEATPAGGVAGSAAGGRAASGVDGSAAAPHVAMDNNAAERVNRPLAVARKDYYGSGAEWSGELAGACFTILGQPNEMSARVALLRMGRDGLIQLPPPLSRNGRGRRRFPLTSASEPRAPVPEPLCALEPLRFQRVPGGRLSALWNELIARYHYLGYRPLSGARVASRENETVGSGQMLIRCLTAK